MITLSSVFQSLLPLGLVQLRSGPHCPGVRVMLELVLVLLLLVMVLLLLVVVVLLVLVVLVPEEGHEAELQSRLSRKQRSFSFRFFSLG